MVKDSGGVDDLEPQIVELGVANVKGLGCEGVRLDFNVGSADAVNKTGLAHIGVSSEEDGPLVGINGG